MITNFLPQTNRERAFIAGGFAAGAILAPKALKLGKKFVTWVADAPAAKQEVKTIDRSPKAADKAVS